MLYGRNNYMFTKGGKGMIEVGVGVQKLIAMIIGGFGGLYLISVGQHTAGTAVIVAIATYAIGETNGVRKAQKRVPEELPLHRL